MTELIATKHGDYQLTKLIEILANVKEMSVRQVDVVKDFICGQGKRETRDIYYVKSK
jgi:hypothetical protein